MTAGRNTGFSSIVVNPPSSPLDGIKSTNILQEGSSVFVRVLSGGAGRYTVSFAGGRFQVQSERQLQAGETFRAAVRVQDGKIFLVPAATTERSGFANTQEAVERFSSFMSDTSGRLSIFLQNLGLPPDAVSLRLVQFFQEIGIKFNKGAALRARGLGLKFIGREIDAAEAALFLQEKGIDADEEVLMELLDVLYYGEGSENTKQQGQSKGQSDKKQNQDDEKSSLKSHVSFLEDLYAEDPLLEGGGLLTLLNHLKTRSGMHWLVLPFEYAIYENTICGTIRFLLDTEKGQTKKIAVSAFLAGKTYLFMVYLNSIGLRNGAADWAIDFCRIPPLASGQEKPAAAFFSSLLLNAKLNCKIRYQQGLSEAGFFSGDSDISLVQADV